MCVAQNGNNLRDASWNQWDSPKNDQYNLYRDDREFG